MTFPERPIAEVWSIPKRVWFVLMSWGAAILTIIGLFAFWIWRIDKAQDTERDRAMCVMTDAFLSAPDAVGENEAGQRSRITRAALRQYQVATECHRFD